MLSAEESVINITELIIFRTIAARMTGGARRQQQPARPCHQPGRGLPQDGGPVNGQGSAPQSPGVRRVMGTGTYIALITAGAILRYAVTTTSTHGVNVHVVGLIVLLAGVLGLLLSLLAWGPLNPARRRANDPCRLRRQRAAAPRRAGAPALPGRAASVAPATISQLPHEVRWRW